MDPLTVALVLGALDGLTARSLASAQNVANAGTRAYQPVRVSFEQALVDAAPKGLEAVRAVRPRFETAAAGEAVRLDLELANASGVSHRYAALADLLGRGLQLRAIAARGN